MHLTLTKPPAAVVQRNTWMRSIDISTGNRRTTLPSTPTLRKRVQYVAAVQANSVAGGREWLTVLNRVKHTDGGSLEVM